MRKSRFTEEQIIGILKESDAGVFNIYGDVVTDEMATASSKVAQLIFQTNGVQTERKGG